MNNKGKHNYPGKRGPKEPVGGGKQPASKYSRSPFSWLVAGMILLSVLMMVNKIYKVFKLFRTRIY